MTVKLGKVGGMSAGLIQVNRGEGSSDVGLKSRVRCSEEGGNRVWVVVYQCLCFACYSLMPYQAVDTLEAALSAEHNTKTTSRAGGAGASI